jgi:hypothetical protein
MDSARVRLSLRARYLTVWALVVTSVGISGCGTHDERKITGHEGGSCTPCEDCLFCSCDECADLGFDPERNVLLSCGSEGLWHQAAECPGGSRIICKDDVHNVKCLDAQGKDVQFEGP